MQFLKPATVAASVLALGGLSACGGGDPQPTADTSNRFVVAQSTAAPANTLVLIAGTSTSFPKGNYTLNTGYAQASGVETITGHVIEWVWPENNAFDSGLFFSQTDPRKFSVTLYDQASADTSYRCVSSAWTDAELSELAVVFGNTAIIGAPKCPDTVSIDAAGHHLSFDAWTLLSDDRTKSVKVSFNVSWILQNGSLNTGGGSGSGSGSASSTDTPIGPIGISGSISSSVRAVQLLLAESPNQDAAASIERDLDISRSR